MRNPFPTEWCLRFYAHHWGKLWIVQALVLLLIGFALAPGLKGTPATTSEAESHAQHADTPTIWTCSMHPQIRRDGPGKCPLCGMDLVPVKKSAGGVRTISISPDVMKLMNVQTVPVMHRYVTANVRMVGKIDYDETRLAHITAWVSGRLDRLFVDYTGVEVNKGDHMVSIYSEELYTAQEELISATRSTGEISQLRPSRFIEPIDLAEIRSREIATAWALLNSRFRKLSNAANQTITSRFTRQSAGL